MAPPGSSAPAGAVVLVARRVGASMSMFGKPTPGVPAFSVDPDTARPPYSLADAAAALDPGSADADTLALLELRAIVARSREALARLEDVASEAATWLAAHGGQM